MNRCLCQPPSTVAASPSLLRCASRGTDCSIERLYDACLEVYTRVARENLTSSRAFGGKIELPLHLLRCWVGLTHTHPQNGEALLEACDCLCPPLSIFAIGGLETMPLGVSEGIRQRGHFLMSHEHRVPTCQQYE